MRESEKYPVKVFLGGRDCGKTTFAVGDNKIGVVGDVPAKVKEQNLKGVIVIDTMRERTTYAQVKKIEHPQQYKSGAVHLIVNTKNCDELVQWICDNVRDTYILFEDAVKIIPQSIRGTAYDAIIVDSKNIHCPITFIYHTWMDVPKGFYSKVDVIEIFKVRQHPVRRKEDISNYEEVVEVYERVLKNENPFYHESVNIGA